MTTANLPYAVLIPTLYLPSCVVASLQVVVVFNDLMLTLPGRLVPSPILPFYYCGLLRQLFPVAIIVDMPVPYRFPQPYPLFCSDMHCIVDLTPTVEPSQSLLTQNLKPVLSNYAISCVIILLNYLVR